MLEERRAAAALSDETFAAPETGDTRKLDALWQRCGAGGVLPTFPALALGAS